MSSKPIRRPTVSVDVGGVLVGSAHPVVVQSMTNTDTADADATAIQVARLAGMPPAVITRARAILEALERDELTRGGRPSISGTPADPQQQLGLFQMAPAADPAGEKIAQRLRDVDTDSLTPLQALTVLAELKKELE